MTASIVINTFNRARSLERLLPSLEHLDGAPSEVVVVNGPSTDDTEAVLAPYAGRIKVERCPTANLSRSRNIGIAAAAGDVVIFIDDDALPCDAGWLRRLVEVFERDVEGRIGAAGGASIHRDTEWTEFAGGWTSDYAEQVFNDNRLPAGDVPAASMAGGPANESTRTNGQVRWARRTVGNNSAFRRSALVAIGGFDERFVYYLDEADVCLRLVRAGYEVVYLQDSPVRHYPAASPLGAPFIRNRRIIARSDTYYCLKNGADPLPRRLAETLRRAPRKHFVRELRGLVAEGRISCADLWGLRIQWLRGVMEGIVEGLFRSRGTHLNGKSPASFLAFTDGVRPDRLSICLLSRRLPPDPHAGGVGRYTYDLARGLHALGHRVTVITESDVARRLEGLDFEILGVTPATTSSDLRQTPILAGNLNYAEAVVARVEALASEGTAFDVVHASNWGVEALGVAQRTRLPLTLMLVTPLECVIAAERWDVTLDLAANIELDQWVVEHATRVCSPSSGVLGSYVARAGWSGRTIRTVPLGIACQAGVTRHTRERRRLLFVGRLERRKGVHYLLDVLPRLLERHPHWQCDLVGNTSVPAGPGVTFESLFRQQHAGATWRDRVVFHGALPDAEVQRFYREADLFVAPSLFESFGLIYQEAMQYGVPVVGCRVGGVPEVVKHGEHGLLVEPGNAAALEGALDRLMSDHQLRTRMGASAEHAVRTHGSHTALAQRMVVEYRAAIADGATRAAGNGATDCAQPLVDAAMSVLEMASPTKGLGLAFRAAAAEEHGAHAEAAELIASALGVSPQPEYFAMAFDLALSAGDVSRSRELAIRGFVSSRDDSDACATFAAGIVRSGAASDTSIEGWHTWWHSHAGALPPRWFSAALTAIRSGRDSSAIVLLEAYLASGRDNQALNAQVRYHLGSALKRRGRHEEARAWLERAIQEGAIRHLPPPLSSALHFHLGELDLLERRASAVDHFEACLAINPAHGRARTLLSQARASEAAAA